MEELLKQALRMLLPPELTNDFDLIGINKTEMMWKVRLEEKAE